jgi:hypothetical protein
MGMPKRPPGVYKRGSTWSVVIDHGRDPKTGKRKRVWHAGFVTLSEAAEERIRLLRERDTGATTEPSRQTLAAFIRDEWLPSRAPTMGRPVAGIVVRSAFKRGTTVTRTWSVTSYPSSARSHCSN